MKDSGKPVGALRNIGPKSATMLASTGIRTLGELRLLGPVKAYLRLKAAFAKRASRNMLWALAAGLEERDWRELAPEEKTRLLAAVNGR